jgi:hypothetical protein
VDSKERVAKKTRHSSLFFFHYNHLFLLSILLLYVEEIFCRILLIKDLIKYFGGHISRFLTTKMPPEIVIFQRTSFCAI